MLLKQCSISVILSFFLTFFLSFFTLLFVYLSLPLSHSLALLLLLLPLTLPYFTVPPLLSTAALAPLSLYLMPPFPPSPLSPSLSRSLSSFSLCSAAQ